MNADKIVNGRTGVAVAALIATVGVGVISAQTPTMAAPLEGMSEIAKLAARGGLDAVDAMLDARSPGLRMPGALTQTKGRKVSTLKDAFQPKERVLSGERTRPGAEPPATAYEDGLVDGPPIFTPAPMPSVDTSDADIEPVPPTLGPPPPGGYTPPIIVTGGGGGGGGGGNPPGGGGPSPPTPPPPPPPPPPVGGAVPEPATWISLLMGFFAIGFGLRSGGVRQSERRLIGRTFP